MLYFERYGDILYSTKYFKSVFKTLVDPDTLLKKFGKKNIQNNLHCLECRSIQQLIIFF